MTRAAANSPNNAGSGGSPARGSWRAPPPPVRVLVACGWLAEADVGHPGLRIDALSSSHMLFRVTAPDGRSVVVKQVGRQAVENGRDLSRELYVYRLASWMPAFSAVLPKPVLIDEKRQTLVVESLAAGVSWPASEDIISSRTPGVGSKLGQAMAAWHRATEGIALWPSPANGVLGLPDALDEAAAGRPQATQELMRSIAADQELQDMLRKTRSLYRHRCLIHGDIRRENWIADGSGQQLVVKVLDCELSGSGDPAWDLGSMLAETVIDLIRDGASLRPGETGWPALSEPAIREFITVYVSAGGLIDPHEASAWEHVMLCSIARLLHVACEWADLQAEPDNGPLQVIMEQARQLLGRRREATAALGAWSGQ